MRYKRLGIVYTPKEIAKFLLSRLSLRDNKLPKTIDIAMGDGIFLESIIELLSNDFNREEIISSIYGVDIRREAVENAIKKLARNESDKKILRDNLLVSDGLFFKNNQTYDLVVGNPPYVGHKNIDRSYRKKIEEEYKEVYYDKGDLSFCFIRKMIDLLSDEGRAVILTSRATADSLNGEGIRKYISQNTYISEIIDFDTQRLFKDINVLSIGLILTKKPQHTTWVHIPEGLDIETEEELFPFQLDSKRWHLNSRVDEKFLREMEDKKYALGDICDFYQGIITGLDKAFVYSRERAESLNIEQELLRPWIKNSQIDAFQIKESKYYLLYADDIDPQVHNNAIRALLPYKERLSQRRECLLGRREWYQLQWGRKKEIFLEKKLIFPYKSATNRFALDDKGLFFSADCYFMKIKKEYEERITLIELEGILNSEEYQRYFSLIAKKGVNGQMDYYPNRVKELKIDLFV